MRMCAIFNLFGNIIGDVCVMHTSLYFSSSVQLFEQNIAYPSITGGITAAVAATVAVHYFVCNAICNCYVRQWIICMPVTKWAYTHTQFNNNNSNNHVQHLKYVDGCCLFICLFGRPYLTNSFSAPYCVMHNKVCIICSIAFMCMSLWMFFLACACVWLAYIMST